VPLTLLLYHFLYFLSRTFAGFFLTK